MLEREMVAIAICHLVVNIGVEANICLTFIWEKCWFQQFVIIDNCWTLEFNIWVFLINIGLWKPMFFRYLFSHKCWSYVLFICLCCSNFLIVFISNSQWFLIILTCDNDDNEIFIKHLDGVYTSSSGNCNWSFTCFSN